jgi:Uri superfamily endonuclease
MMRPDEGTYALLCTSASSEIIDVGRLGRLQLQPGFYLYIGSAFGPGGLRARIDHHRHESPKPHWHIDYLRLHVPLTSVWFTYDHRCREHLWARVAEAGLDGELLFAGFGASDCNCCSHLVYFKQPPNFRRFAVLAHAAAASHASVHELRSVRLRG